MEMHNYIVGLRYTNPTYLAEPWEYQPGLAQNPIAVEPGVYFEMHQTMEQEFIYDLIDFRSESSVPLISSNPDELPQGQ